MTVQYGVERFSDTVDFEDLEQPVRLWPVVVETTTTYVIWEEGETHQEAIDACKRDGALYEAFTPDAVNGSGWEVLDAPSPWQYEPEYAVFIGPRPQCPDCLRLGEVGYQGHEYACPQYVHTIEVRENTRAGEGEPRWRANCWCALDKFEWRMTEAEAEVDMQEHVAGRQWKAQTR